MVLRKNMEVGVLRKYFFREIWKHAVNALFIFGLNTEAGKSGKNAYQSNSEYGLILRRVSHFLLDLSTFFHNPSPFIFLSMFLVSLNYFRGSF